MLLFCRPGTGFSSQCMLGYTPATFDPERNRENGWKGDRKDIWWKTHESSLQWISSDGRMFLPGGRIRQQADTQTGNDLSLWFEGWVKTQRWKPPNCSLLCSLSVCWSRDLDGKHFDVLNREPGPKWSPRQNQGGSDQRLAESPKNEQNQKDAAAVPIRFLLYFDSLEFGLKFLLRLVICLDLLLIPVSVSPSTCFCIYSSFFRSLPLVYFPSSVWLSLVSTCVSPHLFSTFPRDLGVFGVFYAASL